MNIKKISFQKLVIQALLCLMLLALPFSGQTPAASAAAGQPDGPAGSTAQQPLETLLNPDGSLKLEAGFSGSLDPSGWNLRLNADGEPRFIQTSVSRAPGERNRSGQSSLPSTPSPVESHGPLTMIYAIVIDGTDVYLGGSFQWIGNGFANNIIKWNSVTSEWEELDGGVSGDIYALALYGNYVYAGGNFDMVGGGTRTNSIARWDRATRQWSAMGSGLTGWNDGDPIVRAITLDGSGNVYVGGNFSQALPGAPEANNLAFYSPARGAWYSIAQSMGGPNASSAWVNALAIGDKLYAGGSFTEVGSSAVAANNIAAWDGANWLPLGDGISGQVDAIGTYGSKVYAGGDFAQAGGLDIKAIAQWDWATGQWSAMGTGLIEWDLGGYPYARPIVRTITVDSNGIVYVGGNFNQALPGAPEANNLAFYYAPTGTWYSIAQSMGGPDGLRVTVRSVAIGGAKLYAGGNFAQVGSDMVKVKWNAAVWNGNHWAGVE